MPEEEENFVGNTLEDILEATQKELLGMQQMLGHVLQSVGHPVFVGKDALTRGIPDGAQIRIDDDLQGERFIFSLELPDGD